MSAEDVLCSRTRMRILKLLVRLAQLDTSEIARRIESNFALTKEHLRLLADQGITVQIASGRRRFHRINQQSAKAKAICKLVETWEETSQKS